jgi:hypothetical protein
MTFAPPPPAPLMDASHVTQHLDLAACAFTMCPFHRAERGLVRYGSEELQAAMDGGERLGSGGSGDVYRVRLRDRVVALKKLKCVWRGSSGLTTHE